MKFRHPNRVVRGGPIKFTSGGSVGLPPTGLPETLPPPVVQEAEAEIDFSRVKRFAAWPDGSFQYWEW